MNVFGRGEPDREPAPRLRSVEGDAPPPEFVGLKQLVIAARQRGDRSAEEAKQSPRTELPPTASNIFASIALDFLRKREEVLNKAIAQAEELDMLAGEAIACGARTQDFFAELQQLTANIMEARPALASLPTPTEPEPPAGPEAA